MTPPDREKLLQYIDEHTFFYTIGREQFGVHSDSVTPFMSRQDGQTLQQHVIAQFRCRDIEARLLGRDSPLIYGELDTGASSTLLLSIPIHCDTQTSQEWDIFAASLAALDAYRQVIGPLPVNIKWLLNTAVGNPHTISTLIEEHHEQLCADGCISECAQLAAENGIPLLTLGAKGLLCVELAVQTAQTASTSIPSAYGAIVPNALWRLTWALSSLKSVCEEILIEGFYDTLAPAGDNEIELLYALEDNAHTLAQYWGMKELLLGLQGFQLHYTRLLTPTCTVNAIHEDAAVENSRATQLNTIIPTRAIAQVDFHLVPDQDPYDIFAKLQHHLSAQGFQDVQVRMLYGSQPTRTSIDDPFIRAVYRATTVAYRQEPRLLPFTEESNPFSPLRQLLGIPIVLLGGRYSAFEGRAPDAPMHAQNIAASIKQMALLMEELALAYDTA